MPKRTKRTLTKLFRTFEKNKENRFRLKKRLQPLAAIERYEVPCGYCREPLMLAQGELGRFHRACRSHRPMRRTVITSKVKQLVKDFTGIGPKK